MLKAIYLISACLIPKKKKKKYKKICIKSGVLSIVYLVFRERIPPKLTFLLFPFFFFFSLSTNPHFLDTASQNYNT